MSLTHIPAGNSAASLGQSATMLRAMSAKKKVQDVAKTVQSFDQKDGVDLNTNPDQVSVKDAQAAVSAADIMMVIGGNPLAAVPEKVTGDASFGEGGAPEEMDVQVKEAFGSPQQVRFQAKDDGTKIYSAPDLLGYVTVREHKDGTLFISTGKDAAKEFESLSSESFQVPQQATPKTEESQDGLWRLIPSTTQKDVEKVVDQGKRTLGGWLSALGQAAESVGQNIQKNLK